MTAGFTTERQDPDLSRVSDALVRGAELDSPMEPSDED
jgi:hypothetical protein